MRRTGRSEPASIESFQRAKRCEGKTPQWRGCHRCVRVTLVLARATEVRRDQDVTRDGHLATPYRSSVTESPRLAGSNGIDQEIAPTGPAFAAKEIQHVAEAVLRR